MESSQSETANTALLIAGGIIIYSLFRKSAGLGSLVFYPDRVKGFQFDGLTPILLLGLGVQNTSNQDFTIRSLAGNIYSNEYYVGNVSSFVETPIYRNTETVLTLKCRLQLTGIANDIIEAVQNGNFAQDIQLRAEANVDGLQIPITQNFKVGA